MNKMIKFPLILAITGVVCATSLGIVYQIANPIIEERVNAAANEAISAVLPGAKGSDITKKYNDKKDLLSKYKIATIYEVKDESGKALGHGYKISAQGRNGAIEMLVLLNEEKILGVKVLSQSETSSFYDKVTQANFEASFKDLSIKDLPSLDTVTGATLSSKGIKNGVISAVDAHKEIVLGQIVVEKDVVTKEELAKLGYANETFERATKQFREVQGKNYESKFVGTTKDKNGITDAYYRKDSSGNIVGYVYYFDAKYNCETSHGSRVDQTYRGLFSFDKNGANTKLVILESTDSLKGPRPDHGAGFDYSMIDMPLLQELQGFNINDVKSANVVLPDKVSGATFTSKSIIRVVTTICINHKEF